MNYLTRSYFLKKIWISCRSLFLQGPIERRSAYNLLCLFLAFHTEEGALIPKDCEEGFNLKEEKEFWKEIRKGLVDKDVLVRKQSLHLLKLSLGQSPSLNVKDDVDIKNVQKERSMTKRGKWAEEEAKSLGVGQMCNPEGPGLDIQHRWEAFILLYEMLDEFGTHLVEAAWDLQISLLLSSTCHLTLVGGGIYQNQMGTVEGLFSWLAILWERGFSHQNPQVRCLIMQSFLDFDWEKPQNGATLVPKNFVLGPFIPGLADPVHHKDFGIKGVYSSRMIKGASRFLSLFSREFSRRERVAFLCTLASLAKEESFGRIGLVALAFCIASASGRCDIECGKDSLCRRDHLSESSQEDTLYPDTINLLDALRIITERSKHHFNPNYRLQVCEQVVDTATSVLCAYHVPLDVLMHFVSALPHEFTDYGGPLRGKLKQWFSHCKIKHSSSEPFTTKTLCLDDLDTFSQRFVKNAHSSEATICCDDEDLELWGFEVQRWARMLLLVNEESHHLESILRFIQDYGVNICMPNSALDWVPVKFILLIGHLVQEFQTVREKITAYAADVGFQIETDSDASTQACVATLFNHFEKFTYGLLFILKELLSFAKSSCSIFSSSSDLEIGSLPSSTQGKLGGPSQRRLSSSATTLVLQAILSLKAVASLLSWCAKIKSDLCPPSVRSFLWNFCWKVISSSKYDSETRSEIHLAAYEALVPVLKALSTTVSSLDFELIIASDNIAPFAGENSALLDPFALSFLENINGLLNGGVLTRSRRAVLMNWKWLCLGSLLAVPSSFTRNEVHTEDMPSLFSHATLRSIFADLVECLENASESSVLPMLRCIRLSIGLMRGGGMSSNISSCFRIDVQMMWNLVESAWILHVSCNKRRVAPIAALLSSVLHAALFSDLNMHETADGQPGPLKWFVVTILDEGTKSPRTIRLAALHLTGMWLLYPKTIKFYVKELKLLSLYGSVAFDEDFEGELKENRDAREEVSMLTHSSDHELAEAFINSEMYARVSVAVLFTKLADLVDRFKYSERDEDAAAAAHCGKLFLVELLDAAVNDKDLAKELYKKYSAIHRRKVRAWQMICVLSRFIEKDILPQVTSNLHICLYRNNLPAVRQYLEIFGIQIYLKFPSLIWDQLIPIFHDYSMRPQALSSYVFIAANVMLHSSEVTVQLEHLEKLLPPIIPFLTSHHHNLRGFTQLLVHEVLSKLAPALAPDNSQVGRLTKNCFLDLKSYLADNPDCMRLRASMEGFLNKFDPNLSATPAGIFTALDEELDFECVPTSLMEQVTTFLNCVREDLRCSIAMNEISIKNDSLAVGVTGKGSTSSFNTEENNFASFDINMDFQKKITLSEAAACLGNGDFHDLFLEMENEDLLLNSILQSRCMVKEKLRESRQPLILVASLLDRIPNLAGLARTCEVFKADGLAVADAAIIHDKQFQLISVTAEKWVPIIEVPVSSMKVFLEEKKQAGFSILGLEQTANSTPLDKYSFQRKTVLVLGREKEGIPVDIIHILDACIEIPQLGVVRSLNVHVSGAIALWEYTRQQRSKQGCAPA